MISAGVFLLGFQAPFRLLPRHRAAVLQEVAAVAEVVEAVVVADGEKKEKEKEKEKVKNEINENNSIYFFIDCVKRM